MSFNILDGRFVSTKIGESLKQKGFHPNFVIVLVGNDAASQIYVKNKIKVAKSLDVNVTLSHYDENVDERFLLDRIEELNDDPNVHGIIVQLPLPKHLSSDIILNAINPQKDIDGLHPYNYGRLVLNNDIDDLLIPATPLGILLLLQYYQIETVGKHAVIVGRGLTVGTPLAILLSKKCKKYCNMTVTLCNSLTLDLAQHTRKADLLISATGQHHTITAGMVKEGAVVIDVGITKIPDATKKSGFHLSGDVDFEAVKDVCEYITPVPGGVGPMTIIALLKNLFYVYERYAL